MEPKGLLPHLQVPAHIMALNKYVWTLFRSYSSSVML